MIRRRTVCGWAATLLLAVSAPFAPAEAEELHFTVSPGLPTAVKFTSIAPLETFRGGSDQVSGWFQFDPDNLAAGLAGELVADMTTFRTGIPVRDRHMLQNHLQVDTYPTSRFKPEAVGGDAPTTLETGIPVTFHLRGTFTIHGVSKTVEPEVTATLQPDLKHVKVQARFDIPLEGFSIPRPEFLLMRVGDTQKVEVDFTAHME